jgi:hypothetical protein
LQGLAELPRFIADPFFDEISNVVSFLDQNGTEIFFDVLRPGNNLLLLDDFSRLFGLYNMHDDGWIKGSYLG